MASHEIPDASNQDPLPFDNESMASIHDMDEYKNRSLGAEALEQALRDDAKQRGLNHDQGYEDKRLDDLANKLGNYEMARLRLGINDPEMPHSGAARVTPINLRAFKQKKPKRVSRRGGRSYPEPGARDRDIENDNTPPLSPEQRATNQRGRQIAQEKLDQQEWNRIQSISDPVDREKAERAFHIGRIVRQNR